MERVGVLINKLQEQLLQNANARNMLVTVQMLQSELLLHENIVNGNHAGDSFPSSMAAVLFPQQFSNYAPVENYKPAPKPEPEPVPVAEPQAEPEIKLPEETPAPTPKPEPQPIPHFIEQKPWETVFPLQENFSPHWNLDPAEVPTLTNQQKAVSELNDTIGEEMLSDLNDKLKENKTEMASVLQETPIHDLKKAISINDRHSFISELFRGDETMYERSIKTINSFHIFPEAEYWIQRELKVKLGWDITLPIVKVFDQFVKRRFA